MIAGVDARAALLADLDYEAALTAPLLRRVPETSMAWAPHPRAFSLGALTSHLAELPHWGVQILASPEYDFNAGTGVHRVRATMSEVLDRFDRHLAELHGALTARSVAELHAPWTLRHGPRVLARMTRLDAVRRFALHHLVHHRGQLTVYLRVLDVPLPPMYGPTADEQP
ncbi:MAG: DinB family protein [Acidobacteriota bacterium]